MTHKPIQRSIAHLVVTLVRPSELTDQASQNQLADLRQLGVDDSDQRRKDGRERERRSLGTHDRPRKQSLSSDQILAEQLRHNMLDVRHVDLISVYPRSQGGFRTHLVDQTVYTLSQRVPAQPLKLRTVFIF